MIAPTLRARLVRLWNAFGLWPGLGVALGIVLGRITVAIDREGRMPAALAGSDWIYDGGSDGARAVLGAIASSTIGVAGTVFSITIAALSLAAGQMGPRLLRNFTSDRGNQVALGIFLGTFAHALVALRSVRATDEGAFVPHLAVTVALLLALLSVGTLVWFVGHMASRINVDTVMELVAGDVERAFARLTTERPEAPSTAPAPDGAAGAAVVRDPRRGYLQDLDTDALADWAAVRGATLVLRVRPGDHVFPGAPIAHVSRAAGAVASRPAAEAEPDLATAAGAAIAAATALGPVRDSRLDLEFAIRQLVEVAVRALSAGVNDPYTAIGAIDRLGATLCGLATRHLPSGRHVRDGRVVLVVPAVDYDGLCDAMFHQIRQWGARDAAVMARLLEVFAAVRACERDPRRVAALRRHADLALVDAERTLENPADLADVRARHARFVDPSDDG